MAILPSAYFLPFTCPVPPSLVLDLYDHASNIIEPAISSCIACGQQLQTRLTCNEVSPLSSNLDYTLSFRSQSLVFVPSDNSLGDYIPGATEERFKFESALLLKIIIITSILGTPRFNSSLQEEVESGQ